MFIPQTPFVGIHDGGDRAQAIENAINRLETLSEMPAAIFDSDVSALLENNPEILDLFLRGITSAEAATQELHNMISLWLIE